MVDKSRAKIILKRKPIMKNSNFTHLKPFVKELPSDKTDYIEILTSSVAVNMRSGYVSLKRGESVGEHSTGDNEEMLIILEGEGEIEVGGIEREKIKQGQIAYNPPNTKHNVYNTNSPILRYIYVVTGI
jgi:mannose-6-phosphate isomerase-like protein (cupin superfamily)